MSSSFPEVLANLPKERRKMIKRQTDKLNKKFDNKEPLNLIDMVKQQDKPQLRNDAYTIIMEWIDELMGMASGEGPKKNSAEGILLDVFAKVAEEYEEQKFFVK